MPARFLCVRSALAGRVGGNMTEYSFSLLR